MDSQAANYLAAWAIKLTLDDPYEREVKEPMKFIDCRESPKFEVRCHAGGAGHLEVCSDSVSVRVGQRVRREGKEELWGSLLVECKEHDDGSLTVEVVVCHPDWDEPLKIACIESNPAQSTGGGPSLRCDFQQKQL